MKIKVTRPDGTVIEAEGTAEECASIVPPGPVQLTGISTWPFRGVPVTPIYPTFEPQVFYSDPRSTGGAGHQWSYTITNANGVGGQS